MNNVTNSTLKKGVVGTISPKEKKKVSLDFKMFYGDSEIKIFPECKKS
jgi:hypothetical protein